MDSKPSQVGDLSLEELLKHAEDGEAPAYHELKLNDVQEFVAATQLKEGENSVSPDLVYQYYLLWSKDPVTKRQFNEEMELLIPTSPKCFYYLDKSAFVIADRIKKMPLKNEKNKSAQKHRDHLSYFFASNGISKGDFHVPIKILYSMYETWCKKNGYNVKFKYEEFRNAASAHLKRVWTKEAEYFKVHTNIFKYMSRRQLEKLQDGQKKADKKG